jgi:hypothetical protein
MMELEGASFHRLHECGSRHTITRDIGLIYPQCVDAFANVLEFLS